jgi:threonyl-tRNA synthetase
VAERHIPYATEVCDILTRAGIRCDIDDREESVGKKVREAGMDWVPYVAVVGDSEAESGLLTVTIRKESQPKKPYKEEMTPEGLAEKISAMTAGKPTRKIYTPKNLSLKPRFI